MNPRFLLKVSRPGLWFQTLWLYVLPVAGHRQLTWEFWLGVVYVLFPLNLMVYGWNDLVDRETDAGNPRKDSYFFGARGTAAELARLPMWIVVVNAPFVIGVSFIAGWKMAVVFAGIVGVLALYNLPRHGLRARPPFELLNVMGYLLLLPLSILLNGAEPLPWQSVAYLSLFCLHAHLMGEIMDVEPDRRVGRRTTATVLGAIPTKVLALLLVIAEGIIIVGVFRDWVLGAFLLFGALWLAADLVIFRDREYTRFQYRLLGTGLNGAGFASMLWVWHSGTLTRLP